MVSPTSLENSNSGVADVELPTQSEFEQLLASDRVVAPSAELASYSVYSRYDRSC